MHSGRDESHPREIGVVRRFIPAAVAGAVTLLACAAMPVSAQSAAPAASAPSNAAPRMQVDEFKVIGNTLLPQSSLDTALAPYKGERSIDELKQAASAVQALYAAAGYGAVVAYLPEQSPSAGVVTITVVEGRVVDVVVRGNSQFSEANIRKSLPALVTGATPNLKRIDSQIQIANENPAKQLQVLLQPGQRPGEAEARVTVTERPVQTGSVGLDNTGNDRTGDWRASLGWQHANVWGRDHVWSAQLLTSPENVDAVLVLSTAYRVPLYEQQLVVDGYAAYSHVDGGVTATVAGDLQFTGEGRLLGLRASRYLARLGEVDQRLSVGFDYRDYTNSCEIVGLPVGACGPAGESVSVQPLWAEYTAQKSVPHPMGVTVSLHHNLQIGGGESGSNHFEAVRRGAKPRYTLLRAAAFVSMPFGEDWQVQARLNAQFTGDALVPSEQFGIGGAASVRGYEERELAGDRGLAASVEVITPDVAEAVGLGKGALRFLAFADAGAVENRLGTPCVDNRDSCSIGSAGVGARFSAGGFGARLYVARSLKSAASTDRNDTRAHVALSYLF